MRTLWVHGKNRNWKRQTLLYLTHNSIKKHISTQSKRCWPFQSQYLRLRMTSTLGLGEVRKYSRMLLSIPHSPIIKWMASFCRIILSPSGTIILFSLRIWSPKLRSKTQNSAQLKSTQSKLLPKLSCNKFWDRLVTASHQSWEPVCKIVCKIASRRHKHLNCSNHKLRVMDAIVKALQPKRWTKKNLSSLLPTHQLMLCREGKALSQNWTYLIIRAINLSYSRSQSKDCDSI